MQPQTHAAPLRWHYLFALGGYVALVAAMNWPLLAHLSTHVIGQSNGDTFEALYQLRWMARALFDLRVNPFYAPDVFYPQGWYLASGAQPPWYYLALAPAVRILGDVLVYNLTLLSTFVVAGMGAYALAYDQCNDRLAAFVAGCVYVVAPVLTLRLRGHLNVMFGAQWLPWVAWAVLRALRTFSPGRDRRARWAIVAGACLGLTVAGHWYYLYMATLPLAALALVAATAEVRRGLSWRRALGLGALMALACGVIVVPCAWLTLIARRAMFPGGMTFDLATADFLSLSPDRLLLPNAFHPLLATWVQRVRPLTGEHDVVGMGLAATALGLLGLCMGRRQGRGMGPLVAMALTALILAMGTSLHWADARVEVPSGLSPAGINTRLGVAEGHSAIPLPGLALALWAPLYDSMRVWGAFAIPLMVALAGLASVGGAWLRRQRLWGHLVLVLLGGLIVAEGWVAPYINPYDVTEQELTAVSVNARPQVNALLAALPAGTPIIEYPRGWADKLAMYAQTFHHQPVANGYMSRQPDRIAQADSVLGRWPVADAMPLLRHWGVRYLVFSYYPRDDFDQALGVLLEIPGLALETHLQEGFGVFTETFILRVLEDQQVEPVLALLQIRGAYSQELTPENGTFRWTGPTATLIFGWPVALPTDPAIGTLELSLAGGRNEDVPPCHLAVAAEGTTLWEGDLPRDFAPRALLIPLEGLTNQGAPELEVTLHATAWLPTSKGDERPLGVQLYGARVRLPAP